mgnify:FL=1
MALTKVLTGGIADDAITSAKIPADAVTNSELNLGSDYAFTGTVSGVSTITTLNSGGVSVSGNAEADFLNLPSGIKRINVMFYGVSAGSDTGALVRLGTSSGLKTSGYLSISHYGSGGQSDSSGFMAYGTGSSNALAGILTINHMGGNVFVSSHSLYYNNSNGVFGGGRVDLGGTLDRLRVTSVSGGNFDAGIVNINYEL